MLPIDSGISLNSLVLLVFYLAAIIYLIFSLTLYYHWNEFGPDSKVSKTTAIVYLGLTLPLVISLGVISLFIF